MELIFNGALYRTNNKLKLTSNVYYISSHTVRYTQKHKTTDHDEYTSYSLYYS